MQPRTMHIYWAEHERHLPPVSEAGLRLSESVHRRWQQYRTSQQQSMSLLAKRLLQHGLRQLRWRVEGGLYDLCHHPNGKPYLAQLPVQFSLSHSKQVAVCALSADAPVGIDVQAELPVRPGSDGLFLTPAERPYVGTTDQLTLWCRKEAAYKAVGHELGAQLTHFRFTDPLRVACPPVTLTLIPQPLRPGYVCYLALPAEDPTTASPLRIIVERVHYPY